METKITLEEAQEIWRAFADHQRQEASYFLKHEWKILTGIPHIISADGIHVFHFSPNTVTPGYVH